MLIYKITNKINGKVYIGQTIRSLKKRFNEHCNNKKSTISKAIQKYGKENFTIEEIDGANNQSELNYKEWLLIYKFNSLTPNGYNIYNNKKVRGKWSGCGIDLVVKKWKNKEFRKNILPSYNAKQIECWDIVNNVKVGVFDSQKEAERYTGVLQSNITHCINKVYKQMSGFYFTNLINYKGTQQHVNKMHTAYKQKYFKVYDTEGLYIGTWDSPKKCADELGLDRKKISRILSGKYSSKTHNGYTFIYISAYSDKLLCSLLKRSLKRYRNKFAVYKLHKTYCEYVGTWGSQVQCERDLNLCKQSISPCLNNKKKSTQGYFFKYI